MSERECVGSVGREQEGSHDQHDDVARRQDVSATDHARVPDTLHDRCHRHHRRDSIAGGGTSGHQPDLWRRRKCRGSLQPRLHRDLQSRVEPSVRRWLVRAVSEHERGGVEQRDRSACGQHSSRRLPACRSRHCRSSRCSTSDARCAIHCVQHRGGSGQGVPGLHRNECAQWPMQWCAHCRHRAIWHCVSPLWRGKRHRRAIEYDGGAPEIGWLSGYRQQRRGLRNRHSNAKKLRDDTRALRRSRPAVGLQRNARKPRPVQRGG